MTKEELIDAMVTSVMENFDFAKVHRTLVNENWKWVSAKDVMEVPSHYKLMKEAERILRECAEHYEDRDFYSVGTGGFIAAIDNGTLTLEFVLTSYTTYAAEFLPKKEKKQ